MSFCGGIFLNVFVLADASNHLWVCLYLYAAPKRQLAQNLEVPCCFKQESLMSFVQYSWCC